MSSLNKVNVLVERSNKIIYREGDKLYKTFDESYSKSNVLNEGLNQARIEETGLKIPKVIEVSIVNGRCTIIMEFIEGVTLEKLMQENPDKLDEYLDLFVNVQLDIHSRRSPLLTKFKDKMTDKILKSDLDASTRYDLAIRWKEMADHNSVLHCDFNPSNVIINSSGEVYVVDWSHASQGHSAADAAKTYLIFELDGKKEIADKYLKKFCEKTSIAEDYARKWIPLIAAAQLVKGKVENRAILMKYINSVE